MIAINVRIVPREEISRSIDGVDFSKPSTVLARKENGPWVIRHPGASVWNGMHGTSYAPSTIRVWPIGIEHDGPRSSSSPYGRSYTIHTGRVTRSNRDELIAKIDQIMQAECGHIGLIERQTAIVEPQVCQTCRRDTLSPSFDGCMHADCPRGEQPCL